MFAMDWQPSWAVDTWVVPVVGLAACGVAWFVGRRLLAGPPRQASDDIPRDHDFLQGITRDRRGAARRKGNTIELLIKVGTSEEPIKGWILDRSIGGVCLLVDEALAEGTPISIRRRQAGDVVPWIEATVKSCRSEGSQYEVGCQFLRTPNWSLLLQFG